MNLLFIYVGIVIAAGVGVLASFGPAAYPPATLVATLAAAMLVVSYFKLRLPLANGTSTISMRASVSREKRWKHSTDLLYASSAVASFGVLKRSPIW